MKLIRKVYAWTTKFLAWAMFLGLPGIAVWGALVPWPPGQQALASWPGYLPALVAVKISYVKTGGNLGSTRSQTYALFPVAAHLPGLVTVAQSGSLPPTTSNPNVIAFFSLLVAYALSVRKIWRMYRAGKTKVPEPGPASAST